MAKIRDQSVLIKHERLKCLVKFHRGSGLFTARLPFKRYEKGDIVGSMNTRGYIRIYLDGVFYLGHRLAWFYVHGTWPSNLLDHKNGVFSDNRLVNLRECDTVRNGRNRKRDIRNTTGKTGACILKGRFQANIKLPGRRLILGSFDKFADAVAARIEAEKKYFKEFRRNGS